MSSYEFLANQKDRSVEVLGFVDTNADVAFPEIRQRTLGTLKELDQLLMNTVVDEVLITLPIKSCYASIQETIASCERSGVQSRVLADLFSTSLPAPRLASTTPQTLAMPVVAQGAGLKAKRVFDFVASLLLIVLLSPVLIGVAVAVRLTSRGPSVFVQERCGLRKRTFRMYKFRTMVEGAEGMIQDLEDRNEAAGPIFKMRDDPRLTRIGGFLRRTSIDELPQLFNVLRGEMSLVGPRPMSMRDVRQFTDPSFMRRFSVVPGITGLWQVNGRSTFAFESWLALDLEYIDHWSFWLDLKILANTVPVVFSGEGAV